MHHHCRSFEEREVAPDFCLIDGLAVPGVGFQELGLDRFPVGLVPGHGLVDRGFLVRF